MRSRLLLTIFTLAAGAFYPTVKAQTATEVPIKNIVMERNGNYMKVAMDVDLTNLNVKSNRSVEIVPYLVNQGDSLELNPISVYGRNRYYYTLRNNSEKITSPEAIAYKTKSRPDNVSYETIVPYSDWQSGSSLIVNIREYGCCDGLLADNSDNLGEHYKNPNPIVASGTYVPELIYVKADAEKEKQIVFSGQAYVQFPVNQTVIYEDFRNNAAELGKIKGLIDTLKMEKEVQISHVTLKGYASPEGSYANNERLAKGRVEALKKYVDNLYQFAPDMVKTSYEPEDWEGLKVYVENSNLSNKDGILNIIDSDLQPDAKDAKIRSTYPSDYAFLLQHCYPALRHTDYSISCNVKHITDLVEIRELLQRNPKLLSLNEIYLLANTYEPGSDEFNDLYETAVRLYPNDEVANLNVANVAIRRGELDKAAEYLKKAGNSAETNYTKGVVAYLKGDKTLAEEFFNISRKSGTIDESIYPKD
jgi:outer membrane protein OmpA-like peptidoglycan-associated protein